MKSLIAISMSLPAAFLATSAKADNLITINGQFSGSLNGNSFVSQSATFTAYSPGEPQNSGFGRNYTVSNLSALMTIDGQTKNFSFNETGFRLSVFSGTFYSLGIDANYLFNYDTVGNTVTTPSSRDFLTNAGLFRVTSGIIASTLIAPVSAVPEPSAWALMISGIGFIGAGMRRRRAAVSFA